MAAIVTEFSAHFVRRWEERCGGRPDIDQLNAIIEQSQKIRNQQKVWRSRYGQWEPWYLLAEYWSRQHGMIIFVDERYRRAVTLIKWGHGCLRQRAEMAGGNGNGSGS